mgnify:CR=1 FL=1
MTEDAPTIIRLDDVSFTYADAVKPALDHVSLEIPEGGFVGVIGPSGAGKSTLAALLSGAIPHHYRGTLFGSTLVDGRDTCEVTLTDISRVVGSVAQDIDSQMVASAVEDEMLFGLENFGVPHDEIEERVTGALGACGVLDLSGREIATLSGGQKQKVAIAAILALRPRVLVLDEPTSNLDMQAIMDLRSYVATAKAAGASVLVAEHRLWWLAGIADEIVVMGDGRVTKRLSAQEFASLSAREVRELGLRVRSLNDVAASARVTADSQTRLESAPRADGRAGAGEVFQAEAGLDVRDARAGYRKHEVLRGVDLSVRAGEVVALVGRNGAGKSTLSRAICGLAKGSGAFRLFGKEVSERERLSRSSMVFQDVNYQLFAESAASEVVFGLPKDRARSIDVEGILSSLGLRDVSGRHPATLSGGQKQRLAVASCVAAGKDVLVFDEPTSGLDLESMRRVASLIRRLADEGRVVLVVTHDLEFIACACDRAVELSEGVVAGSYDVAGGVGAIRRALFVDSQCDDWT